MDLAPLRHREFRLLYAGQMVSFAGSMLTAVALPYQTYELTNSSLAVGLIGLAEVIPTVGLALITGALADVIDRRRMVMLAEAGAALAGLLLVANALLDSPHVWVLYAAAVIAAGCYALLRPPLDAMVPRLVPAEEMPAAMALETLRGSTGQIIGPAIGGLLVATAGVATTYAVDIGTFVVSLGALGLMRTMPPPEARGKISLEGIAEGFRYAVSRQELLGTYLVDMNAMFFGFPKALFPAVADRFGGAEILGLLFASPAIGSLAASTTAGWVSEVRRHGRAVAIAAAVWGAGIVVFGLADALWLCVAALVLAGAADTISGIFRGTMWNQTIPDRLRGRLAGIEMISWSSGPTLGDVESGVVATLVSVRAALVSGGILCIAGTAVLAALLPRFWHYRQGEP